MDRIRSAEVYGLASRYPFVANSRWFEDVAGRHIAAVAATLPLDVIAAAQEHGRARDRDATVAELLAELRDRDTRGRGGAGFTTALKWKICSDTEAEQRYVVCNADEGEPGTFKDRLLLQQYADRVIEGMTMCGLTIGATKGFIYLRGEYRYLLDSLQSTLDERRQKGLLGENILGKSDHNFDISIHLYFVVKY